MKYLITGPSGAGKSTLAKVLSEDLGLSKLSLDDRIEWKEFMDKWKNSGAGLEEREACYQSTCSKLIDIAVTCEEEIIEGQQLLEMNQVPEDAVLLVLLPTKQDVVMRRVERSRRKGKPDWSEEKSIRTAEELYEEALERLLVLRGQPGVIILE